jgi:hypothetical protein
MRARCDQCRRPLRTNRVIPGPDGLQFDSEKCRRLYLNARQLKSLENTVRVARSRLKAKTITRAVDLYRASGGRESPLVERLLRSVL